MLFSGISLGQGTGRAQAGTGHTCVPVGDLLGCLVGTDVTPLEADSTVAASPGASAPQLGWGAPYPFCVEALLASLISTSPPPEVQGGINWLLHPVSLGGNVTRVCQWAPR